MLHKGVQDIIKTIGDEGCYALTLCRIGELSGGGGTDMGKSVDDIERAVLSGYLSDDMTVLDAAGFLRQLTLMKWTKDYKDASYKPVNGDYLIAEWFNQRTGKTHFTLEYPEKWNSLRDSVTVREGKIRSYRLCRIVK
jgi:hypothetical protein